MNSRPLAARSPSSRRPSASGGPGGGRRWAAFVGAGVLVAVGYMDPGNWATALAGGAGYGYALLGVVIAASLMAMLLQWLAAPTTSATSHATIAISAAIHSSTVALQMLLGVSLSTGVLVSAVGTLAMLALERHGRRTLEAAIASLIFFVGLCFVIEVALARPDWHAALAGAAPSPRLLREPGMLWLAAGILGATVMPHNLYLHSMLVKHHASARDEPSIRRALFGVNLDTFVSLGFAFVINAALLIVAAAVFHASGHDDVTDLADAHRLIAPLVGNRWAGPLFAAALLACGLSATVTGTLAGQAIMEGFLKLTLPRWQRALLTRALAIGPALAAVGLFGQHGSNQLLVASQVVLSLQLPLAMVPLVVFASSRALMGRWRVRGLPLAAAWMCAAAIVALNGALVWQVVAAG